MKSLLAFSVLLLGCQGGASPHLRVHEAQLELSREWNACRVDGMPARFVRILPGGTEGYVGCADRADRLVPEGALYWQCRADELEETVACVRTLDCDLGGWEACETTHCSVESERGAMDWTCAHRQCLWDLGVPADFRDECVGWTLGDPSD